MSLNDKHERRLARQRGAGPRELKNAAFNFTFGALDLPAQLSTSNTPSPKLASPKKTPQLPQPARETPAPKSVTESTANSLSERSNVFGQGSFKTPTTTGKRKRQSRTQPPVEEQDREPDELEITREEVDAYKASPAGQAVRSRSSVLQTPSIQSNPEELDELSPDMPVLIDESELPQLRRVSIPVLPLVHQEERPAPSPDRRPPREERGRSRTRKSVISVSLSRSRLRALDEEDEDAMSGADSGELSTSFRASDPSSTGRISGATTADRRTSGTATFEGGTTAFLRTHAEQSTRREVFEISDESESSESEDELTPQPTKKLSRRQTKSDIDVLPDADADTADADAEFEDDDQDELSPHPTALDTSLSTRTPLADTTANTQRIRREPDKSETEVAEPPRKKHKSNASTATGGKPKNKPKFGGPTISVTVWRHTKGSHIPDTDPLGEDPNPVAPMTAPDILSQISGEIIKEYIDSVPSTFQRNNNSPRLSKASKKGLRFQLQALNNFKDNLADSLRNISFAQGAAYIFGGEVRRAKKQKRELREELMARRRERERIEVEIDRVRSKHVKAEEEDARRRALVDDVEGIAEAVRAGRERAGKRKRGDEDLHIGLGAQLLSVKRELGVLERVKEFNAFLERAAGKLEASA